MNEINFIVGQKVTVEKTNGLTLTGKFEGFSQAPIPCMIILKGVELSPRMIPLHSICEIQFAFTENPIVKLHG
jgi:hypothetical protein